MDLYARQVELEQRQVAEGQERYERNLRTKDGDKRPEAESQPGVVLLRRVVPAVAEAIDHYIYDSRAGRARVNASLVRFLAQFDVYKVSFLTARTCINAISHRETLTKTAWALSGLLEDELDFARFKEADPGYWTVMMRDLKPVTHYGRRRTIIKHMMGHRDIPKEGWGKGEKIRLGETLIGIFIETTGLVRLKHQTQGPHNTVLYLEGTESAREWLENQHDRCSLLHPVFLPMVVPPSPWMDPWSGGYVNRQIGRFKMVKTRDQNYLEELQHWDMPLVYRAVNAVQETAWRVNRKVFEVMDAAWQSGGGMEFGLVPREFDPLPAHPFDFSTPKDTWTEEQKSMFKAWKQAAGRVHELNHSRASKRLAVTQKLNIAREFLDDEAIYFPHVLDFRGRCYPVVSLVNPQQDDPGKVLIEFSRGLPLGEEGVRWLAIAGANSFGVDKVPHENRVQWVHENEAAILESAENPLDGSRFWTLADKPWQFLAFCFEWARYKVEGEGMLSHLPCPQDGSNNGLQNFAAMLRDEDSGAAVNLRPAEKPQDIYQIVADKVSEMVLRDVDAGVEAARQWVGKVSRKVVKRNVMTLPYGATKYGFREQIVDVLKKADEKGEPVIEGADKFPAAVYLANLVDEAIGSTVQAATSAMAWLQETAKVVTKDGLPVRWTTPIGFPVLQAYRKTVAKTIRCQVGGMDIRVSVREEQADIDSRRQSSGIAPNFVHSMDASHMMLTVNKCLDEGITDFAMVHDSYATHACNTPKLNRILREAFVEQYSRDVLEDFRAQLVAQLPEELAAKIPPVPPKGDLDIQEVLQSPYFFA